MKRGFTLIELLAVITIIAIISMVILPMVSNQIDESKEDLYQVQVDKIEQAAKDYLLSDDGKEMRKLLRENNETVVISISDLQDNHYLDKEAIKNPMDSDKNMEGVVEVTYQGKNYIFKYVGEEGSPGSDTSYRIGNYILDRAGVKNGTGEDGLYRTTTNGQDIYYFRGDSPHNYIQLITGTSAANKEMWNIVSLDTTNRMVKLVRTRKTKVKWSNEESITDSTLSNAKLRMNVYLNETVYGGFSDKLKGQMKATTWSIGEVASADTFSTILTEENAKSTKGAVSLLSVGDYLNAMVSDTCRKMTLDATCSNWLLNLAEENVGYFLRNTVKNEDKKVWTITRNGLVKASIISEQYAFPVISLSTDLLLDTSMDKTSIDPLGSSTNPYILDFTK